MPSMCNVVGDTIRVEGNPPCASNPSIIDRIKHVDCSNEASADDNTMRTAWFDDPGTRSKRTPSSKHNRPSFIANGVM